MSEEQLARNARDRGATRRPGSVNGHRPPVSQPIRPEIVLERDMAIAQQCGRQVEMRVSHGEFAAAYAAVTAAQRSYLEARQAFDAETLPLAELGIDVRTQNMLERAGIHNAGQLARASDADLLGIASLGQIALSKIRLCLEALGL